MTDPTLTPSRSWKRMTLEQRLRAAQALWRDDDAAGDQVQAAGLIAKHMKFRPRSVAGLDRDRKAGHLATIANVPEELAARLLIVYHLAEQRPMMAALLDTLGIAYDHGLIQEDAVAPDPATVGAAAAALARDYPAHDVALYLNTLPWQDPASWGGLQGLPEISLP
jgi:hypothetical protein